MEIEYATNPSELALKRVLTKALSIGLDYFAIKTSSLCQTFTISKFCFQPSEWGRHADWGRQRWEWISSKRLKWFWVVMSFAHVESIQSFRLWIRGPSKMYHETFLLLLCETIATSLKANYAISRYFCANFWGKKMCWYQLLSGAPDCMVSKMDKQDKRERTITEWWVSMSCM